MRRQFLIAAVVALVMLDGIIWTMSVVAIAIGVTAERHVPTFGLVLALMGCALVWLTVRAAREARR
jgi:uncharacterized membrane protein